MNKRIIYPNGSGGVAIVVPSPNFDGTIEALAAQVVPADTPYQIVDVSDIPEDRTFRDAWTYEQPTEGV